MKMNARVALSKQATVSHFPHQLYKVIICWACVYSLFMLKWSKNLLFQVQIKFCRSEHVFITVMPTVLWGCRGKNLPCYLNFLRPILTLNPSLSAKLLLNLLVPLHIDLYKKNICEFLCSIQVHRLFFYSRKKAPPLDIAISLLTIRLCLCVCVCVCQSMQHVTATHCIDQMHGSPHSW